MKKNLIISMVFFAAFLVLSNYLISSFTIFGTSVLWSQFIYPITFFVSNIINKKYGPKKASVCVLIGIIIQCIVFAVDICTLHTFTLNFAIVEIITVIVGQGLNIFLFSKLGDSKQADWKYIFLILAIIVIADNAVFLFLGSMVIHLTFNLMSFTLSTVSKLIVSLILSIINAKIGERPKKYV